MGFFTGRMLFSFAAQRHQGTERGCLISGIFMLYYENTCLLLLLATRYVKE